MNDMRYLIVNMADLTIFTMTHRPLSANALKSGDGELGIRAVTSANFMDYKELTDWNMFYNKIYAIDQKTKLVELDEKNISQSWKDKREILRLRQQLFFRWESSIAGAFSRVSRNKWEHFDVFAEQEIAKCDPSNNHYTWIIEEYARVLEEPVDVVYKELKLKIESDNVTKFRIQALAEKWKRKINECKTVEDSAEIKKEMSREFYFNAMI